MQYEILGEKISDFEGFKQTLSDAKVSDSVLLAELDRLYNEWKSEEDFYFFLEEEGLEKFESLKEISDEIYFFKCLLDMDNRCFEVLNNRQNKIEDEKRRECERESRMREERRMLCVEDEKDGCEFNADYTELLKYNIMRPNKSYIVPKCIKSIGHHAFRNSYLEEVVLQEGMEVIDFGAFYGCQYLRKISMPNTLLKICENAFWKCFSLENIVIPENVSFIGSGAFGKCHHLVCVRIPAGVKKLGVCVFEECDRLRELTLSEGSVLDSIDFLHSCSMCKSLTTVNFPATFEFPSKEIIDWVGADFFEGCPCSDYVKGKIKGVPANVNTKPVVQSECYEPAKPASITLGDAIRIWFSTVS